MIAPPPFNKIAILGVGLLGGSIGLALRRAGFAGEIAGFGHRQSSLDAALASGAVNSASLDIKPVVSIANLVILGSPIGLFERLMKDAAPHLADGALVTDVGSTKRQVVAWARRLLPRRVAFVGSHPIAGSERRGVQYARADLFDGACCVLTPPSTRAAGELKGSRAGGYRGAIDTVDRLWRSLGMWTVRMTPARHDRRLAQVSHLPHATAAALMLLSSPDAQDICGPGFLDSTRIAGGDPELWRDIFLTNAREAVRALEALNGKLDKLAALIARGDGPGLVRYLADAQSRRQALMDRRLKRRRVEG